MGGRQQLKTNVQLDVQSQCHTEKKSNQLLLHEHNTTRQTSCLILQIPFGVGGAMPPDPLAVFLASPK